MFSFLNVVSSHRKATTVHRRPSTHQETPKLQDEEEVQKPKSRRFARTGRGRATTQRTKAACWRSWSRWWASRWATSPLWHWTSRPLSTGSCRGPTTAAARRRASETSLQPSRMTRTASAPTKTPLPRPPSTRGCTRANRRAWSCHMTRTTTTPSSRNPLKTVSCPN